jgi:hypothetical protein
MPSEQRRHNELAVAHPADAGVIETVEPATPPVPLDACA